jgi:hypothetical protein
MTLQEEFMEYRHVGHHDALEHSEALAASHQVIYLPLSPGIPYQEVSSNMEYIKKTI